MVKRMFFIFLVFLLSAIGYAGNNRLSSKKQDIPFDVNEVVGRVSQRQNIPRLFNSETGEFLIDTSFVYVPNPFYQMSPSIAFDGTNYLVVWEDDRNGDDIDIYGVRVNQAGLILDPGGIVISNAIHDQQFPSVTFDGTNYLVVWHDDRDYEFCDIYGARVNQSGIVLDPNGFVVSTGIYEDMFPCITSGENNLFVVWQDMRNDNCDIYGARITQTGILIDSSGIAISVAADSQAFPAISFDGTNYFVVWQDCRNGSSDIYGARINSSGIVLDTGGIVISTAIYIQGNPSVAFDGINYLVVWDDYRMRTRQIYGSRVTQAGIILDTNGFYMSIIASDPIRPSVHFDGTNYLVTWQDFLNHNWDIYGARVNQAGIVLDPYGIVIVDVPDEQGYSALAFDGTNYLVVWEDFRSGFNWDIYGARVSQIGSVIDANGVVLTGVTNSQHSPSIAFDGTNYLVVWDDNRRDRYGDIFGVRLNQTGTILDPNSLAISPETLPQYNPSVIFGGNNYLVVWLALFSPPAIPIVFCARVSQAGVVLDSNGIIISSAINTITSPSVAFDGTNYLIVWDDQRSGTWNIYCNRVSQTGVVLDTNGIGVSPSIYTQMSPSVAFDGTYYLVVWQDDRGGSYRDIYGARVTQAGIVIDTNSFLISNAANNQLFPAIAFDGTNYLVVWQDERNSSYDIYGARISQAGTVLDPDGISISTGAYRQEFPAIVFDGTNYLIVWQDGRNGSYDIYGAKVNTLGIVVDTFPVSTQTGDQFDPTLARGAGNQVLITYSGWVDFINTHPVKTCRIWGKFYPFVGMEEENSKLKMQNAKLLEINPNPFKNITQIKYNIKSRGDAEIRIYDITGKIVKSFFSNNQQLISNNCLVWDGTDDSGKILPAGVYFCTLKTSKRVSETKQIIILK